MFTNPVGKSLFKGLMSSEQSNSLIGPYAAHFEVIVTVSSRFTSDVYPTNKCDVRPI